MYDFLKRTWAEINLDNIIHNFNVIRSAAGTKLCCVIKADAYGHGAVELARLYEQLGADFFAVSNIEEALELRSAGAKLPILILGYTPPTYATALAQGDISQAVTSYEYARELSHCACQSGVTVKAHIAVDTGMSRIGIVCQHVGEENAADEAYKIFSLDGISVEGMFTHFAVADEKDEGKAFTENQCACFRYIIKALADKGVDTAHLICHCANSAATMDYPDCGMSMVRAGIILYGLAPSKKLAGQCDLRACMEIKATVSQVKRVYPGMTIGYGRTFTVTEPMTIATVPIGYADGYIRGIANSGYMVVNGKRAKIVGRICMDQCMIDVTHAGEVHEGDTVTVLGGGVTADDVADFTGTINYEVVCLVGKRVPRVYVRGGETVGVKGLYFNS